MIHTMKKSNTFKTIVLSMVMTFGLVLPMTAQNDGFFKNNEDYINRDAATGNIINQTFGQDPGTGVTGGITNQQFGVPVGSGLLIMVAAGAGYAVARRKRARKGMTLLLAAAMLLGMTQCKKNVETVTTNPNQHGQGTIFVTLTVDNGSKHEVGLSGSDLGKVTFETGDFLWVVNNNQVSGKLSYVGNDTFEGYIDDDPTNVWSHFGGIVLDDDDYLYFCYTSNQNPEMYDYEGMPDTPPYFVWDMSNQKNKLFLVSFVQTSKTLGQLKADGDLDNLTCMLYNKCALVKFVLSQPTAEDVTLTDVYSSCRLDINSTEHNVGATTYSTKAPITLYNPAGSSASNVRWGILMAGGSYTTNVTVGGQMCANAVTIPALANNQLYQSVAINNTYVFTVDAEGTTVHFSPGNLQYKEGTGWRFAQHQYDAIGSWNTSDWVDLFGWGTWGSGKNPLNTSTNNGDYNWTDFQGMLDGHDDWRTLTKDEWSYVFKTRTDASQKYGHGSVDGVNGMIILPDVWVLPSGLSFTAGNSAWTNSYTTAQWEKMEENGAVFLPAAGSRIGSSVSSAGSQGQYWSSSAFLGVSDGAYFVKFNSGSYLPTYNGVRSSGYSVRLVRTVQ